MKRKLNIITIKNKIDKLGWDKLFKYEQTYYWKKLRDKADKLAQLYPKLLAYKKKKKVKCLTCKRVVSIESMQGCHWIEKGSSGNYWCRWERRNIHPCCDKCNNFEKERHHSALTLYMVKKYGIEYVENNLNESYKIHKKPKRYDIEKVIDDYTKLIKEIAL